MSRATFRNTFAKEIDEDTLDVDTVIAGLRFGVIKESSLPREVHEAVSGELARIKRESITSSRELVLLLGAVGEVRGRTRLQKYAFLVDTKLYSEKTKDLFTRHGWTPSVHGPHSVSLERHVRKAIADGLVEAFPAHEQNGKGSEAYRLTDRGRREFQSLQEVFGKDVALMKELLAGFKNQESVDLLIAHVYKKYPEYAKKGTVRST